MIGLRCQLTLFIILLLSSTVPAYSSSVHAAVVRDYWPTSGWRESTPEAQGMSSFKLGEMLRYIEDNYVFIDGLVVIRNGYLVFEAYPNSDYKVGDKHLLYSVTKSFTSCLVGIAIEEGFIGGTGDIMLSYFPNATIGNLNDQKKRITLGNLLTMRSGLSWDESSAPYYSPLNGIYHINRGEGLTYCLSLPMEAEPGSQWLYNTGASHILSGVVTSATGMNTFDYAKSRLFEPLGISDVEWGRDPGGIVKGGYDLQLTPREMAKFGFLYLNGGSWGGRQIVSREWVEESTTTVTRINESTGYGYQWWTDPGTGIVSVRGLYGQFIFFSRDSDLVFVTTSSIKPNSQDTPIYLLNNYVLPAITEVDSDGSIPEFPSTSLMLGVVIIIIYLLRVRSQSVLEKPRTLSHGPVS